MKKLLLVVSLCLLLTPIFVSAQLDTNLYYGLQKNSDVKQLQEFLIDKGFLTGSATGNFFTLTLKAVKAYQTSAGISSTGYVGNLTRTAINNELATNLSASNQEATTETGTIPPAPTPPATTNDVVAQLQAQIALLQKQLDALNSQQTTLNQIQQNTQQIAQNTTPTTPTPTPVCTPNWQCNAWSNCVNSQQTRNCTDSNNCNTTIGEPPLNQSCFVSPTQTALVVTKYSGYTDQTLNSSQAGIQIGSFMILNNSQQTIVVTSATIGLNFGSYISNNETSPIQNYSNLRISFAVPPTFKASCGQDSCPKLVQQGSNSFTTNAGNIDLTISPNQSYGLNVFVDSGADSNLNATIQTFLSVGYTDPITGSSVTTSPVTGQTITFLGTTPLPPAYTGGLTVSENPAYTDQTINPNTAQAKIGSFVLQNQSTTEPVKVISIYVGLIADMPNFSKMDIFTDSGLEIGYPSNSDNTITNTFTPNNLTLAPGNLRLLTYLSAVLLEQTKLQRQALK